MRMQPKAANRQNQKRALAVRLSRPRITANIATEAQMQMKASHHDGEARLNHAAIPQPSATGNHKGNWSRSFSNSRSSFSRGLSRRSNSINCSG
jgi:hypothetical protein